MPAAEAEEGAAEPAADAGGKLQRLLRAAAEEQGLLDSAQRHRDIVATMTHRMQAEIAIATEQGIATNDPTLALALTLTRWRSSGCRRRASRPRTIPCIRLRRSSSASIFSLTRSSCGRWRICGRSSTYGAYIAH
jgi:hypothetical protein